LGGGTGSCLDTSTIVYMSRGSGNVEQAMLHDTQSIGPMARNFRPTTYSVSGVGVVSGLQPTWAPTVRNVLGLEAAVVVTAGGAGRVKNLTVPLNTGSTAVAAPNTSPAGWTFGDPSGNAYTNILEVVLSGVDGSGTVVACADPRRVQAVLDLAQLQGTASGAINHIYRSDDNSSITSTFIDRMHVGRFCNGAAQGVVALANPANPNLNNQDFDPIRRPCAELSPGQQETSCTDMTTGQACKASDGNPRCTQGLVVALSRGDDGTTLADVSAAIARRVAADQDSIGLASRPAVRGDFAVNTDAPAINRMPFDDELIRDVSFPYMLSRRLFLQFASLDGDPSTPSTNLALFGNWDGYTGQGTPQVAAEAALYDYMTDAEHGRERIDPLLEGLGLIPCERDPHLAVDLDSNNFCNAQMAGDVAGYYAPVPAPPGACYPTQVPTPSSGWDYRAVLGASTIIPPTCCANGAGAVDGGCPAMARLPKDAACTKAADCASDACSDHRFIGIPQCT
jgi:hypothetical protein